MATWGGRGEEREGEKKKRERKGVCVRQRRNPSVTPDLYDDGIYI